MPARLDIAIQRNEDYLQGWNLAADGAPIDITGWAFDLDIKSRTDNAYVIQSGTITITDAEAGQFDLLIEAPGHALGNYGDLLHSYQLPYDLIATDIDGYRTALVAGYIIISRGISA